MTRTPDEPRPNWPIPAFPVIAAMVITLGLTAASSPVSGSTNRRIVTDPTTGLAIYGFDPVAYFVDGLPRPGVPEFEHRSEGTTWRFVNIGNMRAFADAPAIYQPRYGGYGALSIARGIAASGQPVYFKIHKHKLYFFHSPANRHIWSSAPDSHIAHADRNWPAIREKLAR